jgi:chromate transporter
MIYIALFLGFLKVGLFAFGGAYASIPLIREVVIGNGWMNDEMLSYMIAVSESTPGPIIINLATYVGSSKAGMLGAFVATGAVVMPSFTIILLLVSIFKSLLKKRFAKAVLAGLKPCIIGIIVATGIVMTYECCYASLLDTALAFLLLLIQYGTKTLFNIKLSSISLIMLSAFFGIVVYGF